MKNIEYIVTGMRCAGCSGAVQKKISTIDGVTNCNVNLLSGLCTIEANEEFDEKIGLNTINQLGFKAEIKNDNNYSFGNDYYYKGWELIVSIVFASISLLYNFGSMFNWFVTPNPILNTVISMILALPVVVIGLRFYIPGYKFLFKGYPNMDSLVSLGSSVAFIYSLILLFIAIFTGNSSYTQNSMFEAATMIIALIYLGKFIEQSSQNNARDSISGLLDILPTDAIVLEKSEAKAPYDGKEVEKCVNLIEVGDLVVVKAGERIPVDGVVKSGTAQIDSSSLTGESEPRDIQVNDTVLGGYTVLSGKIIVEASKLMGDASINTILRLVSESQNNKSAVTKIVDKVSYYFVPVILAISFITFIVWFFITKDFSFAINRFIATLVVACPCAIGLAIPLANVLSSSVSIKNGLVYKNTDIHNSMSKIDTAVFDKTGTLTTGDFSIKNIELLAENLETKDGKSQLITIDSVLSIIAGLETNSNHPIAKSLVLAAKEKHLTAKPMTNFTDYSSKGISGTSDINNTEYFFGNNKLVSEVLNVEKDSDSLYLFTNTQLLAAITLTDTEANGVKTLLDFLQKKNIHIVMLTGDNKDTAQRIGKRLGIQDIRSELMPSQKYKIIKELKAAGKKVIFVGDGVNDAPSISESDIGISPYGSTDVATDNSDVYLLNKNLSTVKRAYKISTYTAKIIKLNLVWALSYNIIGIFLASGIFSFAGILLQPWMSALIMAVSSICVVLTSLSVKFKFRKTK
ncbi:MAG: copper-translocating P-type ATPase [Treponema sp. CETP13]|nr:MAG: copper-translocating P-type ATPase [Treponema sp. CETP13]